MRPVSARFLRTLTGSHTAVFRARIVDPGQTGTDPTGTLVDLIDGDVQLDGRADIRSTIDVTIVGVGLWPTAVDSTLTPYGAELFAERGIAYGNGSTEWVSLGYFRINAVEQDDAPNGPIAIQGADRMAGIIDAKLTTPQQFTAAQRLDAVVEALVEEAYPAAVIEWDDRTGENLLGRTVIVESDRYAFLNELLEASGKIWYFDYRGVLVIKTPPSPTLPSWVVAGGEGGVLVSVGRALSREGVYNGVIATGEAADTAEPVRGLAVDNDAASPTLWGGPFGRVPREYASPLLTTDAQAQLAAATILRRSLGLPYNVDFTAVPNPALEPDDPVGVSFTGRPRVSEARQIAAETFDTASAGPTWGAASAGGTWDQAYGGTWVRASGTGSVSIPSLNLAVRAILHSASRDVDGYYTTSVPAAALTNTLVTGGIVRHVDADNYYMLRCEFTITGKVATKISKFAGGVYSEIADLNPIPRLTYVPDERFTVRFRAVGSDLRVKIWREADREPDDWTLSVTDTSHPVGGVGLWFWRVNTNTNASPQFHVDNFVVNTVPSLDGSGMETHVIDKLTIPLSVDGAMTAQTREQSLVSIGVS